MGKSKKQISNNIRRLRFNSGEMTQEALAKKVSVTRQTIIALEANRYVPSLLLAMNLAEVFSVAVEDVFSFAEDDS